MSAASDAGSQRRSDMHRPKFGNIASADPASTGGDRVSSRFGRGRAAPMKRQSAAFRGLAPDGASLPAMKNYKTTKRDHKNGRVRRRMTTYE
jgi:hypothetical protein